ncbi:MAG: hypothetical protein ACFFDW_09600 [Candidatus Thorarchaeota archaeon]
MTKISILGNSGSGKSSLAVLLSKELSIPVFHVDKILWKPHWIRAPEDEFTEKHNKILKMDHWILDGVGYKSTYRHRFEKSDIIIYLDIPVEICFQRAKRRMVEDKARPNPYVTENCPYVGSDELQMQVIDSYQQEIRPIILELLNEFRTLKQVIILDENFKLEDLIELLKNNN